VLDLVGDIDSGNTMEPNNFKRGMNTEKAVFNIRVVIKRHAIRAIQIVTAFFIIYFIREVFTKMAREASRKGFNKLGLKQKETVAPKGDFCYFFL
jgi:hypothetical protein